jgi:REP element-mobilizing transposase RayT
MIAGYHVIFGAYGFWLPNDPRGSWSDFVGSWELFRYGDATKTYDRRSAAHDTHDRAWRDAAKAELKYPAVQFTGEQARALARGFAEYLQTTNIIIWACAVLPDHIHLVIGNPGMLIEQLVIQMKGAATRQLEKEAIHPFGRFKAPGRRVPKCFARGEWKVYLDPDDLVRAVRYVQDNPVKEGKRPQDWRFVTPL